LITVTEHNATYIKIQCDDFGVEQELSEFFTFFAPGYRFMPSFKNKMWDGKIRLFNQRTKSIYKGLLPVVYKFAARGGYEIKLNGDLNLVINITKEEVISFMDGLQLTARGIPLEIREYQYEGVHGMLKSRRGIAVAATSAGKSAMIYTKLRYHLETEKSILLIVPTINLVNQMVSDFEDYSSINGWDTQAHVNKLFSGKERIFDKPITISTWQTLASMMKTDQKKYTELVECTDVLICDEAHQFKSTVVSKVVESFINTEFRMGTTGTLDGVHCLHPDTLIKVETGVKKISDIIVGDLVESFNEKTKIFELKPVNKVFKNINKCDELFEITLKTGEVILVTGNHEILTERGWVRADELLSVDNIMIDELTQTGKL